MTTKRVRLFAQTCDNVYTTLEKTTDRIEVSAKYFTDHSTDTRTVWRQVGTERHFVKIDGAFREVSYTFERCYLGKCGVRERVRRAVPYVSPFGATAYPVGK